MIQLKVTCTSTILMAVVGALMFLPVRIEQHSKRNAPCATVKMELALRLEKV